MESKGDQNYCCRIGDKFKNTETRALAPKSPPKTI